MAVETVTVGEELRNAARAAGVPYPEFLLDALRRAAREDGRLVVDGLPRAAADAAAVRLRSRTG